jgi:hypothetical protein
VFVEKFADRRVHLVDQVRVVPVVMVRIKLA